ncbi:hypothetical protein N7456_010088 [Penicillium angulare]|uniref:Uncharacterized protein n=1 Tax=Penicillium angulare TaxID=116970 RepID=A0A9W9F619_9EURO|nr:hypothetical protein N7456_010088 [Penicillium angulare]
MTAEQKQAVIDYLGDWCLFDDWDSMVAAFPPMEARFKDDVFRVFTEAVILKDIFQSVVENPFYYMDTDTHWDGRSAVLPPPHGQELFKHWQNTLRGGSSPFIVPSGEQGVISPVEAEDCNTGIRSWNIRQRYINQLVTNMLSKSSLIAPMRLETDPEKERDTKYVNYRDGQLRRCYGKAADLALQMWVMDDVTFRFDDQVKGVEPFKEQEDAGNRPREEKKWWYSAYNRDWEAHQRDGRIPVLLLWPNIWRVTWYERRKGNGPYEKPFAERHEPGYFEGDEYIYLDERGWVHLSFCSGTVYLGAMGLEKPEDSSSSCTTRRLNDEP